MVKNLIKFLKEKNKMKKTLNFFVLYAIIILFCFSLTYGGNQKKLNWEVMHAGTLLDIDGFGDSYIILKFEDGQFILTRWNETNFNGMKLGQYGTMSKTKDKGITYYCWIASKQENIEKRIEPKEEIETEKEVETQNKFEWNDIDLKSPPQNTTVLVLLKKDIYTTAYLDDKSWKLETNRERVLGGEEIFPLKWKYFER
jgi:hypothetical protein